MAATNFCNCTRLISSVYNNFIIPSPVTLNFDYWPPPYSSSWSITLPSMRTICLLCIYLVLQAMWSLNLTFVRHHSLIKIHHCTEYEDSPLLGLACIAYMLHFTHNDLNLWCHNMTWHVGKYKGHSLISSVVIVFVYTHCAHRG